MLKSEKMQRSSRNVVVSDQAAIKLTQATSFAERKKRNIGVGGSKRIFQAAFSGLFDDLSDSAAAMDIELDQDVFPSKPKPKPQLDLSHGFMKSIIRNQIARDNYDKEVKAQQQQQELEFTITKTSIKRIKRVQTDSARNCKPGAQLYVPPHRKKRDGANSNCAVVGSATDKSDMEEVNYYEQEVQIMDDTVRGVADYDDDDIKVEGYVFNLPSKRRVVARTGDDLPNASADLLFHLQMTAPDGSACECAVKKGDSAVRLAKIFSQKMSLSDEDARKLRQCIDKGLEALQ